MYYLMIFIHYFRLQSQEGIFSKCYNNYKNQNQSHVHLCIYYQRHFPTNLDNTLVKRCLKNDAVLYH